MEVDLRTAVALQDILLPPAERLARIKLEQQIAEKKAGKTSVETTTTEGDDMGNGSAQDYMPTNIKPEDLKPESENIIEENKSTVPATNKPKDTKDTKTTSPPANKPKEQQQPKALLPKKPGN